MSKKIIHVNKHIIALNAKDGGNRPVYTIKENGKTRYAREIIINGPSKFVYDGTRLKCGALAWLVTEADIELIDEMTYSEARESP